MEEFIDELKVRINHSSIQINIFADDLVLLFDCEINEHVLDCVSQMEQEFSMIINKNKSGLFLIG